MFEKRLCIAPRLVALLVGVVLFSAQTILGQDDDPIVVDTDLLTFEISVTGKNGIPVRGLTADDFVLTVDGKERKPDFFKPIEKNDQTRPLSVVFALDVSGSVTNEELVDLRFAMEKFVSALADYNSYFAVTTFGMKVKTIQSFTNKPEKVRKSLAKITDVDDGLSTHAYDAVDYAIRMLEKKSPPRINQQIPKRVVVLITDGFPVGDVVAPSTVIKRANAADTSVYSLIFPSYSRLSQNGKPVLTLLEASGLVEKTGGRSIYANNRDFAPLLEALAEELTASYAVAFYPTDAERDGKKRTVRITSSDGLNVNQNKSVFSVGKLKN
ncbi:MAG: VWA domain-containing protein [Pyrinomonadaceae bacterium]